MSPPYTLSLNFRSEKLQLLPERLDARISDKQFLSAVNILQDALRMIEKSELENVGALVDLRVYFSNQETVRQADHCSTKLLIITVVFNRYFDRGAS